MTADPTRGSVLAAKSVVLTAFLFVTSLVVFAVAALAVTPILESKNAGIDWAWAVLRSRDV